MKEYIDRDALLKDICGNDPSHMEDYYFNAIANAPTADVVEVVRCRDCKHYRGCDVFVYEEGCGRCDHPQQEWSVECFDQWVETRPDDFCSYGERKEQE